MFGFFVKIFYVLTFVILKFIDVSGVVLRKPHWMRFFWKDEARGIQLNFQSFIDFEPFLDWNSDFFFENSRIRKGLENRNKSSSTYVLKKNSKIAYISVWSLKLKRLNSLYVFAYLMSVTLKLGSQNAFQPSCKYLLDPVLARDILSILYHTLLLDPFREHSQNESLFQLRQKYLESLWPCRVSHQTCAQLL